VSAVRDKLHAARLYGILDLGYAPESELESVAGALLDGGVDLLQLRAKGHDPEAVAGMARRVLPRCRAAGVPFIVNDFPAVASGVGADGLHLGQDDGSLAEARALVGPEVLIGRSTHSPAQAAAARAEGFDYIGFGPLFPTPTKEGRPGIGLADIAGVEQGVGSAIPVFCIGGIKPDNLAEVLAAGARRIVIVSGLLQAADITATTREVKELL
jgi:thiamine-phosphate pyrophosphorylase